VASCDDRKRVLAERLPCRKRRIWLARQGIGLAVGAETYRIN
jgi:hypothetical protein